MCKTSIGPTGSMRAGFVMSYFSCANISLPNNVTNAYRAGIESNSPAPPSSSTDQWPVYVASECWQDGMMRDMGTDDRVDDG